MFSLKVDEEIELVLLEKKHAQRLWELIDDNRAYLKQWLGWLDISTTVADAERCIADWLQQFANNNGFNGGIFYRGELVGVLGLHGIDHAGRSTLLGYWLAESYQGKGIVRRACVFLVDYCFNEYNLHRIVIRAASGNSKSRAVAEALGFVQEAVLRENEWLYDHYVDHVVYSKLRTDLDENNNNAE